MINSAHRRVPSLVALPVIGALLAMLTGCVKLDTELTIHDDDTVEGSITIAVGKDFLDAYPDSRPQIEQLLDSLTSDVPGSTEVREYETDEFTGQTVTFGRIAFADFNADQTGSDTYLAISHTDDRFRLDGTWNLRFADNPELMVPGLTDALARTADLRVSATFPARVTEHNGELDGHTVTWRLTLGEQTTMYAASVEPNTSIVAAIVFGASGGVLVLLAAWQIHRLRRHSIGTAT